MAPADAMLNQISGPSPLLCDLKCSNYRDAAAPFARTACSSATTTAPSPIAAPTRLTDPDRTSPMANTPRTLVSSGSGRPDRLFDGRTSDGTSEPVKNEILGVQSDPAVLEPARCRIRADEEKDVADRLLRLLAGHIIAPAYALQLLFRTPVQGNDFRLGQYFDIVGRLDAVDEILRHALGETWPAHQHPDFCSEAAQEDGGLARRVAAPDQNDLLVSTQARLDGRSPIPDSAPLEVLEVRDVEAPVASAGRQRPRSRPSRAGHRPSEAQPEFQSDRGAPLRWVSPSWHRISAPGYRRGQ